MTTTQTVPTVSAAELWERTQSGERVDLLDVRTPAEYGEAHIAFAENAPLGSLEPEKVLASRNANASEPLYLMCRTGTRAGKARQQFLDAGFTNVAVVEGGLDAAERAGLPIVRGKKAVSLERQVRIAAGFLVLLGVVLGWVVHPAYSALAAFVGAGLMFAGITDTCGMAMLLARMPWNRAGGGCPS